MTFQTMYCAYLIIIYLSCLYGVLHFIFLSLLCGMTTFSTAFGSLNTQHPNMTTGAIVDVLKESGPGSTGIAFIWLEKQYYSYYKCMLCTVLNVVCRTIITLIIII